MSNNERQLDAKINVEFEESSNRQHLSSGDSVPTLFGKISKWLKDLKTVALTGSHDDLTNVKSFKGATSTTAGNSGHVPGPASGDNSKFLRGDGTWAEGPVGPKGDPGKDAPTYHAGSHLKLSNNTFAFKDFCTEVTDWNDAITTGFYCASNIAAHAPTETKFSTTYGAFGFVVAFDSTRISQFVFPYITTGNIKIYKRDFAYPYGNNTKPPVWSDWHGIMLTGSKYNATCTIPIPYDEIDNGYYVLNQDLNWMTLQNFPGMAFGSTYKNPGEQSTSVRSMEIKPGSCQTSDFGDTNSMRIEFHNSLYAPFPTEIAPYTIQTLYARIHECQIGKLKPAPGYDYPGIACSLIPYSNAIYSVGNASNRYTQVYAVSSTISTSDRNEKKNIQNLMDDIRFFQLFKLLAPKSFEFIEGTSGRVHVGFIAQDVESAMDEVGLTDLEFAGFCRDIKTETIEDVKYVDVPEDEENGIEAHTERIVEGTHEEPVLDDDGNYTYRYSLRYEEFIALNTAMIQKLDERVQSLEDRLAVIEQKLEGGY